MKVYKNPFVSCNQYFVKTGKASSYKNESSKTKGYIVEDRTGKWTCRTAQFYDFSLRDEMPVVAENRVSIQKVIEQAVINAVLQLVMQSEKAPVRESWEDLR